MRDLQGKVALVTGFANKRSIAYAIAEDLAAHGAELIIAHQPQHKASATEKIHKLSKGLRPRLLLPLDVIATESLDAAFVRIGESVKRLDVLVHCIAAARRDELSGRFSNTSLEGYLLAQHASAYSMIELMRRARPLMGAGGSVITLSYIGSVRTVRNYNVMGSAKAALEANVRYLAAELGPENIRINTISAGPIRTLSASGIKDFLELLHQAENFSALKRNVTAQEVAHTASFLASSVSSGITGQVIYVDGGYNNFG